MQSPWNAKLGKVDIKYDTYEKFGLLQSKAIDPYDFDCGFRHENYITNCLNWFYLDNTVITLVVILY